MRSAQEPPAGGSGFQNVVLRMQRQMSSKPEAQQVSELQYTLDIAGEIQGSSEKSTLFQAIAKKTGKRVVIKQSQDRAMIEREAAVLKHFTTFGGKLSEGSVVQLEDVVYDQPDLADPKCVQRDRHFLALQSGRVQSHCGVTLKKLIKQGRTDVQKLVSAHEVLSAVCFIHKCNVVWGDLKPENFVLFDVMSGAIEEPRLIAIDFGESALIRGAAGAGIPHSFDPSDGVTVEYLSPERAVAIKNNEAIDATHAMDIWSLGMVMYHVIVGHSYFEDMEGDTNAIIKALVSPKFKVKLDKVRARSHEAEHAIRDMLKVDPLQRQTAGMLMTRGYFKSGASISGTDIVNLQADTKQLQKQVADLEMRWESLNEGAHECPDFEQVRLYLDSKIVEVKEFVGSIVQVRMPTNLIHSKQLSYSSFNQDLPIFHRISVHHRHLLKRGIVLHYVCPVSNYEFQVAYYILPSILATSLFERFLQVDAESEWSRWLKMSISLFQAGSAVMEMVQGKLEGGPEALNSLQQVYEDYKRTDEKCVEEWEQFSRRPFLLRCCYACHVQCTCDM